MVQDGIEKIIREIEKTAEQETSQILKDAQSKASLILEKAKNEADEEKRLIISRGEQEARRESQRILADARIQVKKQKIKAQEEISNKTFARAWDILRQAVEKGELDGMHYQKVLIRLITESVISLGKDSVEIVLNSRDRHLIEGETLNQIIQDIKNETGRKITLTITGDDLKCSGGVIVCSTDGTLRVDNTFESRSERFKEVIKTEVAKKLFPSEQQHGA